MKKSILSLIMALSLYFSLIVSASAANTSFTDVPSNHWAHEAIMSCADKGYVSGVGDGRFDPDGKVTFAQFSVMAMKAFYPSTPGHVEGGSWYTTYVNAARVHAILYGVPAYTSDEPLHTPMTRAEMAQMCNNVLLHKSKLPDYKTTEAAKEKIPDYAKIPYQYQNAVAVCYAKNVISGISDGTFDGSSNMTRAQACVVLNKLESIVKDSSTSAPETPETPSTPAPSTPADLTVRSSNKTLFINNVPFCGLMEIGGEPYLPLHYLGFIMYNNINYNKVWQVEVSQYSFPSVVPDYCFLPPQGQVIGTAQPSRTATMHDLQKYRDTWDVPVLTLAGRFPMARVSDLFPGRVNVQGDALYATLPGIDVTSAQRETDLVGQALESLMRSTPKETVKAIHDYIVNTLSYYFWYDETASVSMEAADQYHWHNNRTLAGKYGQCDDYSSLFREMCIRAGIPCEIDSGYAAGPASGDPSHAWNRVYVDGAWTYVDCTWDDPVGKKPTLRYDYFMVDAESLAKTHFWEGDDYPMPAEYDPAWEQLDPNNITSADMYRKCLVAQVMQKKTSFGLRCTAPGAYGGNGCLYFKGLGWDSMNGSYDSKTNTYNYKVEY